MTLERAAARGTGLPRSPQNALGPPPMEVSQSPHASVTTVSAVLGCPAITRCSVRMMNCGAPGILLSTEVTGSRAAGGHPMGRSIPIYAESMTVDIFGISVHTPRSRL
jgi:hypothetical protein